MQCAFEAQGLFEAAYIPDSSLYSAHEISSSENGKVLET